MQSEGLSGFHFMYLTIVVVKFPTFFKSLTLHIMGLYRPALKNYNSFILKSQTTLKF
jgi:hypothetical protein